MKRDSLMITTKHTVSILGLIILILGVFTAVLYVATHILNNHEAQALVQQYGYLGVVVIAFIAGLNLLVPIPAPTFTPIFLAGGLSLPWIVFWLVIGTTIADLLAFFLGRLGRLYVTNQYPKTYAYIRTLRTHHAHYIPWFVLGYASFVPFPNEAFLIPLGILGTKLRTFIIPLIVGSAIYHTLVAFGVSNIFAVFI